MLFLIFLKINWKHSRIEIQSFYLISQLIYIYIRLNSRIYFTNYCKSSTIIMFKNTYFPHRKSWRMISECLEWKSSILTWKQLLVCNQAAYTLHLPPACSNLCLLHRNKHHTAHFGTQLLVSFRLNSRLVAAAIYLHNLQVCILGNEFKK